MTTANFPVYSVREEYLGSVTAKRGSRGDSILPKVHELATKKLRLEKSPVIIRGMKAQYGELLDVESASKKTVDELARKEAVVPPESAKSLEDCEKQTLMEQVASLQQEMASLKKAAELQRQAAELQRKIALRKLLDDVRELLAGRELRQEERGEAWNEQLLQMDLKGLPREAAMLTQFGHGTQQWHSSKAAHTIDMPVIAHAVTAVGTKNAVLYRQLFTSAYNLDAEKVVFAELAEDE